MQFVSSETIHETLDFKTLIEVLRGAFQTDVLVPPRAHVEYQGDGEDNTNTLLLMPAISTQEYAGVKLVTVAPGNARTGHSTIQGVYYLMEASTGKPLAVLDAKSITNWRTAATSALASSYLSKRDASSLLMIGTGSLAPYMIRAHAAIRPIDRLLIFGRNKAKASALADEFVSEFPSVQVAEDLKKALSQVDIISCATSSPTPLVLGEYLQPGQHIDLVGAYKPIMRESDDFTASRSRLFVDHYEAALKESGDILLPIEAGVITKDDLQADLFELCREEKSGRSNLQEITLFKSVGHAIEDLFTAQYLYTKLNTAQ